MAAFSQNSTDDGYSLSSALYNSRTLDTYLPSVEKLDCVRSHALDNGFAVQNNLVTKALPNAALASMPVSMNAYAIRAVPGQKSQDMYVSASNDSVWSNALCYSNDEATGHAVTTGYNVCENQINFKLEATSATNSNARKEKKRKTNANELGTTGKKARVNQKTGTKCCRNSTREKACHRNNLRESVEIKNKVEGESSKEFIMVRARRGQATDRHSLAERARREKINERMRFLQDLVPGCYKAKAKTVILDEIINYVNALRNQVEFLSMKLSNATPRYDFSLEIDDGLFYFKEPFLLQEYGSTVPFMASQGAANCIIGKSQQPDISVQATTSFNTITGTTSCLTPANERAFAATQKLRFFGCVIRRQIDAMLSSRASWNIKIKSFEWPTTWSPVRADDKRSMNGQTFPATLPNQAVEFSIISRRISSFLCLVH
eukprot:Gb_29750 [translate_table: standard]